MGVGNNTRGLDLRPAPELLREIRQVHPRLPLPDDMKARFTLRSSTHIIPAEYRSVLACKNKEADYHPSSRMARQKNGSN